MSILDNAYVRNFVRRLVTLPLEPGYYNRYIKFIKSELQLSDSESLLDMGCGTGRFSGVTNNYTGIDVNPQFTEYARKKYNKNFLPMSVSKLDFKDKSFDKSVILETLHHVDDDTFIKALKEAKRVTKKLVLIAEPIKQSKNNLLGRALIANDIGKFVRPTEQYLNLISTVLNVKEYKYFRVGVTERVLIVCPL